MKIVNLTPHTVNIIDEKGNVTRSYEPSGTVARVSTVSQEVGTLDGVPVVRTSYGDVEGLPDPQNGTVYLVSLVVGQALAGKRDDIYGPDTSPESVVRDNQGQIVGVRRLVKF